jgi:RNA polymerase sigma-70 factor (ECF subfamily)
MRSASPHVLFAAHRDGVFRYLCRIVGADEAPDLTQEVFLRVSRGPVPDTAPEGLRAWVFRIARNLALNHRRDAGRRPCRMDMADAGRPASQETALAMRQALDQLNELDRDVFLFREVAGLSYGEIAASCEISPDAVRSRLHRARQQLRACLQPLVTNGRTPVVRLYDHELPAPPLPPIAIIDALLDGEAVDKQLLRHALDDAEGRDYLVDALALRQLTRDMAPLTYVIPGVTRSPMLRRVRWMAAAVVLVASAAGGYAWGQHDAPIQAASVEAVTLPSSSTPEAPAPTKVIRLEPGVNWTDHVGGQR